MPPPLEQERDIDSYRRDHFHTYSAMNNYIPPRPLTPPYHPAIELSPHPTSSSIPVALSSALPSLTSPPFVSNSKPPTVSFNHSKNPEVSTSQMHQSHMISVPHNQYVSSSMGPSYNSSLSYDNSGMNGGNKLLMIQHSQYSATKVESHSTGNGNIPSFQDILNKIKSNNTPLHIK